jgi:hypothetical protein
MSMDERYVNGACCTWHGSIHEVKQSSPVDIEVNCRMMRGFQIPVCPHCGGPLMECANRKEWEDQAEKFRVAHPEMPLYLEWIETLHGPCVPLKDWDWRAAYAAFAGNVQ